MQDRQLESAGRVLQTLDSRLDDLLEEFTEDLRLTDNGKSKAVGGGAVRVTIYTHDPTSGEFVPLGRRCTNPRFRNFGRTRYADDQGLICQAWEKGWGFEEALPQDEKEWAELVESRHSIPRDVSDGFRLKARSLAAMRLQIGREKVGVIVIEGEDPDGIDANVLDDYEYSRAFSELVALMPILVARNEFDHRFDGSATAI